MSNKPLNISEEEARADADENGSFFDRIVAIGTMGLFSNDRKLKQHSRDYS